MVIDEVEVDDVMVVTVMLTVAVVWMGCSEWRRRQQIKKGSVFRVFQTGSPEGEISR